MTGELYISYPHPLLILFFVLEILGLNEEEGSVPEDEEEVEGGVEDGVSVPS